MKLAPFVHVGCTFSRIYMYAMPRGSLYLIDDDVYLFC